MKVGLRLSSRMGMGIGVGIGVGAYIRISVSGGCCTSWITVCLPGSSLVPRRGFFIHTFVALHR